MSDDSKSKFVTVGEAMANVEQIIATVEEVFSTIEANLVESLTGNVPDESLTLLRAQIQEDKAVALLKLRRQFSLEGLRRFLESRKSRDEAGRLANKEINE